MKKAMWLTVLGFCGALMVLSTFSLATAQDPARVGSTSAPSLLSKPVAERTLESTAQPTREAVFLGTFPSSPTEGTPTPEPVGAQSDILPAEPRPVPEGPIVPQKEGLNTAGQIWVWTDRGCGPSVVYYPGDYITFYFEAAQSGSATLYYHTSSGSYVIWSGYMNANVTYYIPTSIDSSAQGGVRILRILMPSVLAQDYCGFTIQCGGNVGAIYVWTNKGQYGCGGVYNRNEPITIYIQAEQYGDAWLFDYWSDGQVQQIYLGYLQADVTYYIQSTVNEPGGQQVLRAIMPDAYAQDYCSFIVQGAPPTPDARVSRSLTLSKTTANVNEPVDATFTIHNYGNASWTAARVCAAQTGGGGFPCDENVTIAAGGLYDYRRSQSFSQLGTYTFEVVWQDSSSNWHQVPADPGVSRTATLKVVKPWTLMFYLAADNDLEQTVERPIYNSLQGASQNSNVNIVALWDGRGSSDSLYAVFSPGGVTPTQKGELNTGDPNTLRDFVSWAQQNYSAAHYALIISDHGSGVSGAANDFTSGYDWLTPKEWRLALTGLAKLDLLYMHACLMGTIESGYQLRGLVDYYVASESNAWDGIRPDWFTNGYQEYGGAWDIIIPPLTSDTTPEQLATAMAKSYAGDIELHYSLPSSVSVVKLSEVENVATKASVLAGLIKSRMSSLKGILTTFYDPSVLQHFMEREGDNEISRDDEYVDLKDFAEQVEARISQSDIQDAARQLKAAIDNYVVYDKHWNGWTPGNHYWSHAKAHGVSIFFPKPGWFRSFYKVDWLDFATGTNWRRMESGDSVSATLDTTIEWGPMLVEFINQTTPNAPDDPTPPPLLGPGLIRTCQGDANGDGVVNAVDLSILSSEWGRQCTPQQPCRADFNHDGIVNAVDLSILAANWGRQCP